jgi:ribosomal protein S18 acetylase RimI-like enzyme
MTIRFTAMNDEDFQRFIDTASVNFANDKVKNGSWKQEAALEQSLAAFRRLLPDGVQTENHFLKNIVLDNQIIGYLWYEIKKQEDSKHVYLFEILVSPQLRGQGYGTEALELFIQEVKEKGIEDIWLHMFGHNQGALKLYQQIGFEITDYNLKLNIHKRDSATI